MKSKMKVQRTMMCLFAVISLGIFIYSLCFMTDYQELFGLKLEENMPIAIFHNDFLQSANRHMFVFAMIGLATILASYIFEVRTKVQDRFSMIVLGVAIIVIIIFSAYMIFKLNSLKDIYLGLDFQYLSLEGGDNFTLKTRTFFIGMWIYVINIIISATYYISILLANQKYKKIHMAGENI